MQPRGVKNGFAHPTRSNRDGEATRDGGFLVFVAKMISTAPA